MTTQTIQSDRQPKFSDYESFYAGWHRALATVVDVLEDAHGLVSAQWFRDYLKSLQDKPEVK